MAVCGPSLGAAGPAAAPSAALGCAGTGAAAVRVPAPLPCPAPGGTGGAPEMGTLYSNNCIAFTLNSFCLVPAHCTEMWAVERAFGCLERPDQTCHWHLAGKLVLSSKGPHIKGHSVIPAPCTTGTQ